MLDREPQKPANEVDTNMTFERIRDGIANLFKVPVEQITASSTYDDLGLDSMDYFELTMHLEDEFKIEVNDRKFADLKTFGEIVDYVQSLVSENGNG